MVVNQRSKCIFIDIMNSYSCLHLHLLTVYFLSLVFFFLKTLYHQKAFVMGKPTTLQLINTLNYIY